jgi:hypothetical protein
MSRRSAYCIYGIYHTPSIMDGQVSLIIFLIVGLIVVSLEKTGLNK